MKKFFLLFLLFIILYSSVFARFNIYSEMHFNYFYTSRDDLADEKGNHNLTVENISIDISGPVARTIYGRVTYELLEETLENAYLRFSNISHSDWGLQVGQQYNIFGMKNREAEALIITPTIEQLPENRLSAQNSRSIIIDYPVINVGSFLFSIQEDEIADTASVAYKNYTIKLLADKVMEGVSLSLSYQMLYKNEDIGNKQQYSIGIDFDLGSAGISVEHINIDNNLLNFSSGSVVEDCKLLVIEGFYNYSDNTKFLFDYLKVDEENFEVNVNGKLLESQLRIGTSTRINENLFFLTEWGQDKFYNDESAENWYKIQMKAFF